MILYPFMIFPLLVRLAGASLLRSSANNLRPRRYNRIKRSAQGEFYAVPGKGNVEYAPSGVWNILII
jgi:hypothetical protein